MTIVYDIDMADMAAFQHHFYRTNATIQKQARRAVNMNVFAFLLLGLACYLALKGNYRYPLTAYFLLMAIASFFFMPRRIERRWMKRTMRNMTLPANSVYMGSREVQLEQKEIVVKTETITDRVKWKAILYVHETKSHLFLYVSDVGAFIVPKDKVGEQSIGQLRGMLVSHSIRIVNYAEK